MAKPKWKRKRQWEMDEETLKKMKGKGYKRTESNIKHIQQTWKKREYLKKKTSAKKQVSQNYPKANYQVDKRTIRTAYSRHNVSQSVDMGSHAVTSRRRRSDKYDIRAANGRLAHSWYMDARRVR